MEVLLNTVLDEYLRWVYAQPILTGLFTAAALCALAMTLADITTTLVRRFTK